MRYEAGTGASQQHILRNLVLTFAGALAWMVAVAVTN